MKPLIGPASRLGTGGVSKVSKMSQSICRRRVRTLRTSLHTYLYCDALRRTHTSRPTILASADVEPKCPRTGQPLKGWIVFQADEELRKRIAAWADKHRCNLDLISKIRASQGREAAQAAHSCLSACRGCKAGVQPRRHSQLLHASSTSLVYIICVLLFGIIRKLKLLKM